LENTIIRQVVHSCKQSSLKGLDNHIIILSSIGQDRTMRKAAVHSTSPYSRTLGIVDRLMI